ncbi:MAG TPA: IS66 family transposase [Terriglobales bacterium]|nr:IS66 family transposase [Terriglobales bacterium]
MSGAAQADDKSYEALLSKVADLESRLSQVERERDEYRKLAMYLREENQRLKRGLIGHHAGPVLASEGQLSLGVLGLVLGEQARQAPEPQQIVAEHTRKKPVRRPFPEHLPRVPIEVLPPEVEREGLDAFEKIGTDRREVIERRPASLVVVEVIRPKFIRKTDKGALQSQVLVAPAPELPIVRGTAGPGLLADTIVKRWQDHLPLARQESIYRREGIELSRSTLCNWHTELAELAAPLVDAMHADALEAPYLCTDSTGVLVQHPGRCKRGHFWVLVAPSRHVLFQFSMIHDGAAVDSLLRNYSGYVVADAHSVYDHIYRDNHATEVGCWSHARQYILRALQIDPQIVRPAMDCIQALFVIERSIEGAPPHVRAAVRQEKSALALEWFYAWCDAHRQEALQGSPLAEAIGYVTNQKQALARFLEDPRLPIHNNLSERNLRRQAVGRKNWLFVGSEDGAKANTIFVSLLASCAMHRIEPWAYLRDLLCLLPGWPRPRVLELAPVNWNATSALPAVQATLAANIFRGATMNQSKPAAVQRATG